MLPYHAIAHDNCAERLARVEADWRVVSAQREPRDPATQATAPAPAAARRTWAIVGQALWLVGRGRLRPA